MTLVFMGAAQSNETPCHADGRKHLAALHCFFMTFRSRIGAMVRQTHHDIGFSRKQRTTLTSHVMLTEGGISLPVPMTALRRAAQYNDVAP
jgi:hypothetical protein